MGLGECVVGVEEATLEVDVGERGGDLYDCWVKVGVGGAAGEAVCVISGCWRPLASRTFNALRRSIRTASLWARAAAARVFHAR